MLGQELAKVDVGFVRNGSKVSVEELDNLILYSFRDFGMNVSDGKTTPASGQIDEGVPVNIMEKGSFCAFYIAGAERATHGAGHKTATSGFDLLGFWSW